MAAVGMTARARPSPAVAYALASAALFGVSTPLAKVLLGDVSPLMLAGLLYAGSGAGLTLWRLCAGAWRGALERGQWPWLAGPSWACRRPVCLDAGSHARRRRRRPLLNLEACSRRGCVVPVPRISTAASRRAWRADPRRQRGAHRPVVPYVRREAC
jgi:hypothetical protein